MKPTVSLCLLLALLLSAPALGLAQPTPVIEILEKDGNPVIAPMTPPPYLDTLATLGLRVAFPAADKVAPLTWEKLRQYPLLIMPQSPNVDSGGTGSENTVNDLLDRYLQAGGGILCLCPPAARSKNAHDDYNAWLQPYGIQLDWTTLDDDAHKYTTPPPVPWQRPFFLWTSNIAPSPLTSGVKTLYYLNDVFRGPSLRTLTVSADWQVLVSSEPTAVTTQVGPPLGAEGLKQLKVPGTEQTGARPLLAVRQVGKGRLAVFGGSSGDFYFDLGKPVHAQVIPSRGDGRRPSDWLPLLRNLCVWLSEPARTAGRPGGATDRAQFVTNEQYGYRDPLNWEQPDLAVSDHEIYRLCTMHCGPWDATQWRDMLGGRQRSFKFLVGAHSAARGGHGSVAAWKKAALAAGFDGIVFREKILSLTQPQWDAFQSECRAADDATFLAVPGWDWTDWEGNRFLLFNRDLPYYKIARLAPDHQSVQDQEMWIFDEGRPANLPISVKTNPTPWWSYRLYSALPVAVYQGGRQIEDNHAEWIADQDRNEFPAPLAVHLLEDPSEVAAAAGERNFMILAPSLADLQTNPRWQTFSMGTGIDNTVATYLSNGPVLDCFLPLNQYRTTLGSLDVPGSYHYRIFVHAHSDVPLATVELWGGGQCLRRYRPGSKEFSVTIDEQHDRQRGLWLRVVDARGREALAAKIGVHDKRFVFTWCGDHCNTLPWGTGLDAAGHPVSMGLGTHIRSFWDPASGPAASANEALPYIPYDTDTSAPTLGIEGETAFITPTGEVPASYQKLVPDNAFWYGNRDVMIQRMVASRWADQRKYTPQVYGYGGWLTAWGPYFATQPTQDFDITEDDIDFHRDPGQPGFQLCRGEIRFKRALTLADQPGLSLRLGQLGWTTVSTGAYTTAGPLPQPGQFSAALGPGHYFTWPGAWGHGTLFALDDGFSVRCALDAHGATAGMRPEFGYQLRGRSFHPGDVFRYQFLIMRWPVGTTMDDHLDARVAAGLNLTPPGRGVSMVAKQGTVTGTQFILDLKTEGYVFRGTLGKVDLPCGIPVRLAGLNENWTAGLWRPGLAVFAPVACDPDGQAWLQLDPVRDAGDLFLGNLLTCANPAVLLRALQRSAGRWELLAHNPTDQAAAVTVLGTAGGPLAHLHRTLTLAPGEEARWQAAAGG